MKLYVLVRKDLSVPYQAVQAGHAVAQWCLENPHSKWQNHTLVYLHVNNLGNLIYWREQLRLRGLNVVEFREPDIEDELTALAVYADEKHFRKLNLLNGETL